MDIILACKVLQSLVYCTGQYIFKKCNWQHVPKKRGNGTICLPATILLCRLLGSKPTSFHANNTSKFWGILPCPRVQQIFEIELSSASHWEGRWRRDSYH
eukprot:3104783-Amphidinium_carterae.1